MVIVIPGITASQLRDEYPIAPERVWGALPFQKKWDRVALHPDNLRYERDEPARVTPDQLFGVAYGDLIDELRHDLSPKADKPTPVFPFAYDWRSRLEDVESLRKASWSRLRPKSRVKAANKMSISKIKSKGYSYVRALIASLIISFGNS